MSIRVTACLNPFSSVRTEFTFDNGLSVNEIIRKIDRLHAVNTGWRVLFDDEVVTDFSRIPGEGRHVFIKLVPEGDNREAGAGMKIGGGALAVIGAVLVATGVGAPFGAALIGAGVSMFFGGAVLYNMDVPSLKNRESPEQDPSIRGSENQMRPYGTVPTLLGRRRIYSDLAAKSHTWVEPSVGSVYLYQLFCAGQKDMEIDRNSIKIDETLIKDYSQTGDIDKILSGEDRLIQVQIACGGDKAPLFSRCVHEIQCNSILKNRTDEGIEASVIRTTPDKTDELNVDIFFYNGLGKYSDDGSLEAAAVEVKAEYKKSGDDDSEYQLLGYFAGKSNVLLAAELKTKRFAITKKGLSPASYTVRITRVTPDSTDSKIIDDVYVGSIRAAKNESPVNPDVCRQLTLIGVKIKASEKLQNVIKQLNFIAQSRLPGLRGSREYELSCNPASAAVYAMQAEIAQQKMTDDEIDIDAFRKMHEWCESRSYECNAYITESLPISQLLSSIASTCRAEILRLNGRITVIQDIERESPVQLFTPRNSSDYKETAMLTDIPDELKLGFIDGDKGFAENELSVYNSPSGNKFRGASTSQKISLWGVTGSEQARKIGMYKYAVSNHRAFIHTFSVDFEYLMCSKGDWIQYAGDIALTGLKQGRIAGVMPDSDGNVAGILTDEEITMEPGVSYAVRVRKSSGEIILIDVKGMNGSTRSLEFAESMSAVMAPEEGDLFTFGERGSDVVNLIVTDVQCGENLTASLTCVEYAPEIFGVDDPDFVLPDYENKLSELADTVDGDSILAAKWKTFFCYNDSETMPPSPVSDGTNSGWHSALTEESRWMSSKTAASIYEGTWSAPRKMVGEKGEAGDPGADGSSLFVYMEQTSAVFNVDDDGQVEEVILEIPIHVRCDNLDLPFKLGEMNPAGGISAEEYVKEDGHGVTEHGVRIRTTKNYLLENGTLDVPIIYTEVTHAYIYGDHEKKYALGDGSGDHSVYGSYVFDEASIADYTLKFTYSTSRMAKYRGAMSSISGFLDPKNRTNLHRGDHFTWSGEETSATYNGVLVTFKTGRVYAYNNDGYWEENTDPGHLMTALSDVLEVGKEKLEKNNQSIKELLGKLATHETFMDKLNNKYLAELLARNEALEKTLAVQDTFLNELNNEKLAKLLAQNEMLAKTLAVQDTFLKELNNDKLAKLLSVNQTLQDNLAVQKNFMEKLAGADNEVFAKILAANETYTKKLVATEAYVSSMAANEIMTKLITADKAYIDTLTANETYTNKLAATEAFVKKLVANETFTKTLTAEKTFTDSLTANETYTNKLAATEAFVKELVANETFTKTLTAEKTFTDSLIANEAYIDTLTANEAFIKNLVAEKIFTDELTANSLFADWITVTGTAMIKKVVTEQLVADLVRAQSITLTKEGSIQSDGFKEGTAGFRLQHDGAAEFNNNVHIRNGYFSGELNCGDFQVVKKTYEKELAKFEAGTFDKPINDVITYFTLMYHADYEDGIAAIPAAAEAFCGFAKGSQVLCDGKEVGLVWLTLARNSDRKYDPEKKDWDSYGYIVDDVLVTFRDGTTATLYHMAMSTKNGEVQSFSAELKMSYLARIYQPDRLMVQLDGVPDSKPDEPGLLYKNGFGQLFVS